MSAFSLLALANISLLRWHREYSFHYSICTVSYHIIKPLYYPIILACDAFIFSLHMDLLCHHYYLRTRDVLSPLPRPPTPVQEHLIPLPLRTHKSSSRLPLLHEEAAFSTNKQTLAQPQRPRHSRSAAQSNGADDDDEEEKEPFYICTLCHHPLQSGIAPFTFPSTLSKSSFPIPESDGRIFCRACWVWIYDLSICWTCGEIVYRREERVGFGWCWWHWACLACLICRVRCLNKPRLRQ